MPIEKVLDAKTQDFLENIRNHPEENAPRFTYADMLKQRGNPGDAEQAELIQLQCREDIQNSVVRERVIELCLALRRNVRMLTGSNIYNTTYERGFVTDCAVRAPELLQRNDDTFFRNMPFLSGLFVSYLMDDQSIQALAKQEELSTLRSLGIFSSWKWDSPNFDGSLPDFLSSPHLSNLDALEVHLFEASPKMVSALGSSDALQNLRSLALTNSKFSTKAFENLLKTRLRLHSLNLNSYPMQGGTLRKDHMHMLGASPAAKQLRTLDLTSQRIGADGIREIAAGRQFSALEHLKIHKTGCDPDGLAALLESSHLSSLHAIDIEEEILDGVLDHQSLSRIRNLHVHECTDEGLRRLDASPHLHPDCRVDIHRVYVRDVDRLPSRCVVSGADEVQIEPCDSIFLPIPGAK